MTSLTLQILNAWNDAIFFGFVGVALVVIGCAMVIA